MSISLAHKGLPPGFTHFSLADLIGKIAPGSRRAERLSATEVSRTILYQSLKFQLAGLPRNPGEGLMAQLNVSVEDRVVGALDRVAQGQIAEPARVAAPPIAQIPTSPSRCGPVLQQPVNDRKNRCQCSNG